MAPLDLLLDDSDVLEHTEDKEEALTTWLHRQHEVMIRGL